MRHRGFAATGRASDDIERKFRDAAAHDVVEAAHAGRQFVDRNFCRLAHSSFCRFTFVRVNLFFHIHLSC